jgi:hypothetical protein
VIRRVEVEGAVIVVGPDAAEVGEAVRAATAQGERVGALIGSMDDPAFRQALDEMVEELYRLGDANS